MFTSCSLASSPVEPSRGSAQLAQYDLQELAAPEAFDSVCVELKFLGGFRTLQSAGSAPALPSKKAQALLAVLALASPGAVTRDKLCGLLWRDGGDAKQNLRQALTTIRRQLGDVVQVQGNALRLNTDVCTTDVAQLRELVQTDDVQSLAAANELYRGALLDGLMLDEPEFEQWLAAERTRLARTVGVALAQLASHHIGLPDYQSAENTLRRWLELEPCAEEAHRALMRCYDAQGRRSEALEQYQTCRALLKHHLGAEPSRETLELFNASRSRPRAVEQASTADDGRQVSVAVLPLACRHEPALAPIAASLAEDLATTLARTPGVQVLAHATASSAEAVNLDLRELGRELGVRYLVSGGLRTQSDGRLRLSLQLLGEEARYMWGMQTDLSPDLSTNQFDDLIGGIVAQFEQQLMLAASKTDDAAAPGGAWATLRKAMATLYARGWSEDSVREAIQLLRTTAAENPKLALAKAQKALVAALGIRMGLIAAHEFEQEARDAAEQALVLEPADSTVLGYAGCAIADLGEPMRAEPLLERAVKENSANPQAWAALGAVQLVLGRTEAGVVSLRRGLRLAPTDYRRAIWLTVLTWGLARLDRDQEALEAAREACRSDANCHPARLVLALALAKLGNMSEAGLALREARRIRPKLRLEEAQFWIGRRGVALLSPLWNGAMGPQQARQQPQVAF